MVFFKSWRRAHILYDLIRLVFVVSIIFLVLLVPRNRMPNRFINLDGVSAEVAQGIKRSLYVDQRLVDALYQILEDVTQLLGKNHIPYWLDGGTFLGAVRMGGLIPWDDDLDLGLFESDAWKIVALKPALSKLGYDLVSHPIVDYKIISRNPILITLPDGKRKEVNVWVDLFLYRSQGDRFVLACEKARKRWGRTAWYTRAQLQSLKQVKFGPLGLFTPSLPEHYLERQYGEDWKNTAYYTHGHLTDLKTVYKWTLVSEKDFRPALPSKLVE